MKVYIGIDPGLDGGIAILPSIMDTSKKHTWVTPTILNKGKRIYDYKAVYDIINMFMYEANWKGMILIEDTPFVPIKGVKGVQFSLTAIRSLSEFVGMVKGLCIAEDWSYDTISAKTWQKDLFAHKSGDTKLLSIQFCESVYPQLKPFTKSDRATKPHHGMCDALCIAHYAKNHY